MSDRNISCEGCSTNLGTIRDARLRKDIRYFCTSCTNEAFSKIQNLETNIRMLQNADRLRNQTKNSSNRYDDMFKDLFK